jgi:predicted amidohydrolase
MPILEEEKLYNVSYLLHRDGKIDEYRKVHITPNERKYYGMTGGNEIKVFDTDCGKIGIVICYVEFPELPRLLADQGMKILFVPYLTDTQNAYMRVRNCASARAIETNVTLPLQAVSAICPVLTIWISSLGKQRFSRLRICVPFQRHKR